MAVVLVTYLSYQVATNGYISFGQRVTGLQDPARFNASDELEYLVAPYWSNINTRSFGSVSYITHTNKTSLSLLHRVSKYIQQEEQNQFSGVWMLVAEWSNVPSPRMFNIIIHQHLFMYNYYYY